MTGRRLNPVWRHFDRKFGAKKNHKAVCKACGKELQGIPTRLEKHVETCLKTIKPDETPEKRGDKRQLTDDEHELYLELPPNKLRKVTTLDNMIVKTSNEESEALNMQLTRMIIATNSPFSFVDNKQVRKFHDMMRPGSHLAERHRVAGDLLDAVYDEEREKAKDLFKGKL